ncbi:hypothetical protein A2U01_0100959, partial [Trifolium medium]|nr:hypothetical protein [Trifolium medium]
MEGPSQAQTVSYFSWGLAANCAQLWEGQAWRR